MDQDALLVAVVDDEEIVRRALDRLLRSAGLKVVTFGGGAELLACVLDLAPDCIVLDLHMPGISGFETMDFLPCNCPVVAITGHDSPDARAGAKRAAAYLCKPIDDQTLLDAISEAIRKSSLSKTKTSQQT